MAITVIDSTNLPGIMAHANGELQPKPANPDDLQKADDKPADTTHAGAPAEDDDDDVEGDDGLTPRQKRDLSAKMLKAIGKKHRQVREAEEFAADQIRIARDAQRETEELRQKLAKTAPATPTPEVVEPKRENFATESEFLDARIQWGVDQGIARRESARQQAEHAATVNGRINAAKSLVEDFTQILERAAPRIDASPAISTAVQESPLTAELIYHLGKHPEELTALEKLSPVRQLVAIGRIEAKLSPFAQPKPATAKDGDKPDAEPTKAAASTTDGITPSKARSDAPVIKPLSSSSGRAVDPDPREMTTREAIAEFQRRKGLDLTRRQRH
jgi:hypothetical protein